MTVFQHFIGQVEHGQVHLEAQPLAGIRQVVEEIGIPSLEMDGDHPAMGFHTLGDEGLLPGQILDDTLLAARAQAGREHDDMIV